MLAPIWLADTGTAPSDLRDDGAATSVRSLPLKGTGQSHVTAFAELVDNRRTSAIVIPAERAGLRPASEEPEPSNHCPSIIPPAGDYWVPALRLRGGAALAWPG